MPTMIFRVTIQGNIPAGNQNHISQPAITNSSSQSFTTCREINIVTTSMRDAVAFATSTLKPTEMITNVYALTDEVLVDSSCVPRG